jgi:hypothetical protein
MAGLERFHEYMTRQKYLSNRKERAMAINRYSVSEFREKFEEAMTRNENFC